MIRRLESGLTLVEVVCVVLVLAVLVILALPALSGSMHGPGHQMVHSLSNMRQLYVASYTMALDGQSTTNAALAWPGDLDGSFASWMQTLVKEGYLSTNDLWKLLSAPGRLAPPGQVPLTNNTAILAYAVRETSPTNAVFLSTANFTNTPAGGLRPLPDAKPYGDKGFVVFRRDGTGTVLRARQAGDTNAIGSYVPLCK